MKMKIVVKVETFRWGDRLCSGSEVRNPAAAVPSDGDSEAFQWGCPTAGGTEPLRGLTLAVALESLSWAAADP